jgi:hypothetical protein
MMAHQPGALEAEADLKIATGHTRICTITAQPSAYCSKITLATISRFLGQSIGKAIKILHCVIH